MSYTKNTSNKDVAAGDLRAGNGHSKIERPHVFNEKHVLHELKHYLPSQTPLKDFIHHNTLHAFQDHKFYDAIFKASEMFGYQVTLQLQEFRQLYRDGRIREDVLERLIRAKNGSEALADWKFKLLEKTYDDNISPRTGRLRQEWKKAHVDMDSLVHPLLFRVLGCYLDQGIGAWKFPVTDKSFLEAIRELEKNSFVSLFKRK
ncbi:MAG TPA: putative inorganic carbon transporter subunit DabA, partial [Bacteroidia bacterium]|nr:putative inorganic carbon transporter subunit DabA [Bacteroidia bacterium]